VHSATYEPFGLVLLEAMAAGLPVVALDGRGNRELIVDGQNGYLLNQGDEENFMKRISDIIHSSQIWNHVHDNAIRLSKKHDMRDYIHTLVRTYA